MIVGLCSNSLGRIIVRKVGFIVRVVTRVIGFVVVLGVIDEEYR